MKMRFLLLAVLAAVFASLVAATGEAQNTVPLGEDDEVRNLPSPAAYAS